MFGGEKGMSSGKGGEDGLSVHEDSPMEEGKVSVEVQCISFLVCWGTGGQTIE